jgi:hypothetical protein
MSEAKTENASSEAVPFDPSEHPAEILLNIFMTTIEDPNDPSKRKPYGKVGFQTMGPKTDKIVTTNLKTFKAALDAGQCKDLEGNVVYDRAVVMLYGVLSRPRADDAIPQVTGFMDASSLKLIEIDASASIVEGDDEDLPF